MLIGIIKNTRPSINRRRTVLGNPKRVEPAEATETSRLRRDEFIPSSTQPDADFLELYFSAAGAKSRVKPK